MRILSFIIICISVLSIAAFFMPWIKGAGSLAKPIDDSTRPIQEIEPTGIAKETVRTTKGIVDTLTEALTPIRLKQTLAGYQIPISKNKEIKKIGNVVYLLFALPVITIICAIFSILGNRKKIFDLFAFLIALCIFILMYGQTSALNKKGLFVEINACCGFVITLYSFLAISIIAFIKAVIPLRKKV